MEASKEMSSGGGLVHSYFVTLALLKLSSEHIVVWDTRWIYDGGALWIIEKYSDSDLVPHMKGKV